MGIKKVTSYEFGLSNNDWNEIMKALPRLAARELITGYDLSETLRSEFYDEHFLDLLENRFGLSLAREAKEYLENNDKELCLEDIPSFVYVIKEIDVKVKSYIDSENAKLKASDFEDEVEFEEWYDNFNSNDIAEALWNVIRSNQNDPFVDKIFSELEKYH